MYIGTVYKSVGCTTYVMQFGSFLNAVYLSQLGISIKHINKELEEQSKGKLLCPFSNDIFHVRMLTFTSR